MSPNNIPPVSASFLILAVLGLLCCESFSLLAASTGNSLVAVYGLLIAVTSLVAEKRSL